MPHRPEKLDQPLRFRRLFAACKNTTGNLPGNLTDSPPSEGRVDREYLLLVLTGRAIEFARMEGFDVTIVCSTGF